MAKRKPAPVALDLDEAGEEFEAPSLSKTDSLAAFMASLEFQPKAPRHADCMEFFRTYTDPSGKVARVVSVVKKDAVGLEPERVSYFVVSVQIHVPATHEGVDARAPAFARTDMHRVLAAFDDNAETGPTAPGTTFKCDACGVATQEFYHLNGKGVCGACHRKSRT